MLQVHHGGAGRRVGRDPRALRARRLPAPRPWPVGHDHAGVGQRVTRAPAPGPARTGRGRFALRLDPHERRILASLVDELRARARGPDLAPGGRSPASTRRPSPTTRTPRRRTPTSSTRTSCDTPAGSRGDRGGDARRGGARRRPGRGLAGRAQRPAAGPGVAASASRTTRTRQPAPRPGRPGRDARGGLRTTSAGSWRRSSTRWPTRLPEVPDEVTRATRPTRRPGGPPRAYVRDTRPVPR